MRGLAALPAGHRPAPLARGPDVDDVEQAFGLLSAGRRPAPLGLIVMAAIGMAGCTRKTHEQSAAAPVLQSKVQMNDASAGWQLKSGFYGVEGGSWRWTARNFAVTLAAPADPAHAGAKLHFRFTLPDAVINKLGPIQLSASVDGMALKPELYSKAGNYDYEREVGAGSQPGTVTVEFSCDKALKPSGDERRELALIAVSVGLESH